MLSLASLRSIFFLLFLLCEFSAFAQRKAPVKQKPTPVFIPKPVPTAIRKDVNQLAGFFRAAYPDTAQRTEAIYDFVVRTISYDYSLIFDLEYDPVSDNDSLAGITLNAGSGVCAGISALFVTLCRGSGIQAYPVVGYVRQSNFIAHAWAAVLVGGRYHLYDPTWDTGFLEGSAGYSAAPGRLYFRVPPNEFIVQHMPFHPMWQLLDCPVSYIDFDKKNLAAAHATKPCGYLFADSITNYMALSEDVRLQIDNRHIRQEKPTNYVTLAWARGLENKRRNLGFNRENTLYEASKSQFYLANKLFNEHVNFYNRRFRPAIPDSELKERIDTIVHSMALGHKLLNQVVGSFFSNNFQQDKKHLLDQLVDLETKLAKHRRFVDKYLETSRIGRPFLFVNREYAIVD